MARKPKKERIHMNAVKGSTAHVLYEGVNALHKIEMVFVTDDNKEVTVTMDAHIAADVLESGVAAYQAIHRPIRFARMQPFG